MTPRRVTVGVAVLGAWACTGEVDETSLPAIPGTSVAFDPDADVSTPETFFDHPWPSDTRLVDGHPDVEAHPRPPNHTPSAQLIALVSEAEGFSTVPTIVFRFDADVAPAHPTDGPRGAAGDGVRLVALDDGETVPLLAHTPAPDPYTPAHSLSLTPYPGFVLRPRTTYAAVVLRDLKDAEGERLGVPATVRQALADGATPGLDEALRAADIAPDDVAALTVFTTGDEVARSAELAAQVRGRYAPAVEGLALDPNDGATHPRYCELVGHIRLPQFQSGTPPFAEGGRFVVEDGELVEQRTDDVPVVITVPKAEMPASGWPVVWYGHGSDGLSSQVVDRGPVTEVGGEPTPGLGPAHVLARHGIAAVSMGVLLGPERLGYEGERAYLNLQNLSAYRDTWRQAQLDVLLLLDALADVSLSPETLSGCAGASLPDGADAHVLDVSQLLFIGQSAGAHLATEVGAIDPRVTAVAPTGSGGYWSMLLSGGSRTGGPPALFAFALGTDVELTVLHPGLALLQHAWEGAEPMVYAPRLARRPLDGHPVRQLYVAASADDGYFPQPIYDAMAVAYGLQRAGPAVWPELDDALALAGLGDVMTYPAANNVAAPAPHTAVVVPWAGDGLVDSHAVFAQSDGIKHQYGCFFATWLTEGTATVVAPGAEDAPCD